MVAASSSSTTLILTDPSIQAHSHDSLISPAAAAHHHHHQPSSSSIQASSSSSPAIRLPPPTTSSNIPASSHPTPTTSTSTSTSTSTAVNLLSSSTKTSNSSTPSKPSHVRRPNWSTTEDEQLCRSWLENSFDPVTNAIQKGTQFWNRVADDFASRGPGHIERNKDHVRNRWQLLQAKVIKFTLCYDRIQSLSQPNEKSHDEIISEALRLYEREESHKFTFYSSWLILRNSDRWIQWSSHTGQKRSLSSSTLHHHHLHHPHHPHHPISDIAVSPHSTVSLLDSDESPATLDPPLNRFISSGLASLSGFHHHPHTNHSPSSSSKPEIKTDRSIPVHTLDHDDINNINSHHHHHHHHHHHPNRDNPNVNGNTDVHPYSSLPSSAPPSIHYHPPSQYRRQKYTPKKSIVTLESENENSDRLMAMAIKRKADVQEAALEVQLLAIDPDQITDPLRKEVYLMKMEEIRDRYKAKRIKSSATDPIVVVGDSRHQDDHHQHHQQQQQPQQQQDDEDDEDEDGANQNQNHPAPGPPSPPDEPQGGVHPAHGQIHPPAPAPQPTLQASQAELDDDHLLLPLVNDDQDSSDHRDHEHAHPAKNNDDRSNQLGFSSSSSSSHQQQQQRLKAIGLDAPRLGVSFEPRSPLSTATTITTTAAATTALSSS